MWYTTSKLTYRRKYYSKIVVSTIVKNGLDDMLYVALSLGLGGGFGSVAATYLHSKILTNETKEKV
jgi:hypothetical protein